MPRIEAHGLVKAYALDGAETARTMRDAILGRKPARPTGSVKLAVNDLTFDVGPGERVGIVGRNGAGKSTLLHMLAGISLPSAGDLRVDGKVTSILTLGVGMREDFTGRENIYLDGEIQGRERAEIDALMGEIVEFAELGEFIDRPVRTYSTGMKARLAFAMISHIDPEILLIDEALTVGDAAFSAKASRRIREICGRGRIVIVVSHGMRAICEICNRCLWMEDGRILMDGDPARVTAAYIESVRSADEKLILQKFRSLVGAESVVPGNTISRLGATQDSSDVARSMLASERPWTINIAGTVSAPARECSLTLAIERLDGLLMVRESTAIAPDAHTDGQRVLDFDIAATFPASLAHGTYRVSACLQRGPASLARHATIIELTADDPPSGGRPALLYPYSMKGAQLR